MTTESKPTMVISAEDDSFGSVANLNLSATAIIGYNKMELLNKNILNAMPHMYG